MSKLVDILNSEVSVEKIWRLEKYKIIKLGRSLGLHKMDPGKCLLMALAFHAGGKTTYWVAANEYMKKDYLEGALFTVGGYALSTIGWTYLLAGGYKFIRNVIKGKKSSEYS